MKCAQCGKEISLSSCVFINLRGLRKGISFCCYHHYAEFWKGTVMENNLWPEWKKTGGKNNGTSML